MTALGVNFLKCAFAAPDFDASGSSGVPDAYCGRSLLRQHALTSATSFVASSDTYILVLPVPGIAYYTTTVATGLPVATATWSAVQFQDFGSLFSVAPQTSNVTSFRCVSLSAEIQPTVNEMTWAGNITTWRQPFRVGTVANLLAPAVGAVEQFVIMTGFQGLSSAPVSQVYSAPFNKGVYMLGGNRQSTFEFSPIYPTALANPMSTDTGGVIGGPFTGMGTIDGLVMKVSIPTGSNMSSLFRVWACYEYTPEVSSALYQYSVLSAPPDELALAAYRHIITNLPVAVGYRENANFWQRILALIRGITNATSMIPGPVGAISTGVRGIAEGIASL
jgi:hypothetical protein